MAMTHIAFTESQIVGALNRAQPGIAQYVALMDLFPSVDVSVDREFQRQYNHFYRVRQRRPDWYKAYYSAMQELRVQKPSFGEVLDIFRDRVGSCEASFSSKLVATLDTNSPVWDQFVLTNMDIKPLRLGPRRFEQAKVNYEQIQKWYQTFLASENGRLVVSVFRNMVMSHPKITDLKKVDFVLWQTRPDKTNVN